MISVWYHYWFSMKKIEGKTSSSIYNINKLQLKIIKLPSLFTLLVVINEINITVDSRLFLCIFFAFYCWLNSKELMLSFFNDSQRERSILGTRFQWWSHVLFTIAMSKTIEIVLKKQFDTANVIYFQSHEQINWVNYKEIKATRKTNTNEITKKWAATIAR